MICSTSSASPKTGRTGSVGMVDVPESATSPSASISMLSQAISDSQESRVHFEETPEIILFLSADEGLPDLPAVTEEDERENSDETRFSQSQAPFRLLIWVSLRFGFRVYGFVSRLDNTRLPGSEAYTRDLGDESAKLLDDGPPTEGRNSVGSARSTTSPA